MLRTKSLITNISEVPREWVFEHYLELTEKLTGQNVRIKSVFNAKDSVPSFFVFYSTISQKYLFKDFSTDFSGDGTELVKKLFNLTTRGEAVHKIICDYNKYTASGNVDSPQRILKVLDRYKVTNYTTRTWNIIDKKYWSKFKISSRLLERYNVRPLKEYVMSRTLNGDLQEIVISHGMIYGYFKQDGTLYKIYQPQSKFNKFIKVLDYIQGSEQLTFEKPYLIINSSLKDIMAFEKLKFSNAESVAPNSENTLIPEDVMSFYKTKYKKICTLLDNDAAGIKSMIKYQEIYDLPYAHLKIEKDLSDSLKSHGVNNTRIHLYPILTKALTGNQKQLI